MSRRILIVDDNGVTRKLVRRSLGSHFDVLEAHDATSAVASARSQSPDLILQDMVLPDVDGFELLRRLRDVVGPTVPILAFTGLVAHRVKARLGAESFDDVVSKPFDPTRLLEIVRGYFPSTDASTASLGAQRTIVLADDDPIQLKLAMFRLSRMGFEVFPAGNGEEALNLARVKRPHAIVSDVLMPKMDGFELCSRVRADSTLAATPVLLLTNSYLEERDFDLANRVGADGYVVRTPELTELAGLLERTLSSQKRRTITPRPPDPSVQSDRMERALRQLDRQVALNSTLVQRNAMLSAELAILGGLTTALAEHGDPESALDTALSACFDAGGISWGVLMIRRPTDWSERVIGLSPDILELAAPALTALAHDAARAGAPRAPRSVTVEALRHTDVADENVLVVPVLHRDEILGVLMLGAGGGLDEHRIAFAGVVAGQIAQTLALSRTFEDYERATEQEKRRSRLLQSILDAIEDPIVVLNPAFEATQWNHAGNALVGLADGRPEGWPAAMSLYDADQRTPAPWEDLPGVRAIRGERVARRELVSIPGNGQPTLWMHINAQPVRGEDGRVEGAVVVVRDVTHEKLAQAQMMFADRMASIGVLAASVAHEINNPLATVTAELEMAIEDTVDHPVREGLVLAREAAARVQWIVRDLKTLSRGETDDVSRIDIVTVMESALRMAGAHTRTRAAIHRELAPTPKVVGNEARLGQVFLNLLVNAADALPQRNPGTSRITVRTAVEGDRVVAEVADNGTGMPPEVKARLFTPFFTTKPVGLGSGLGLSVSQRIVAAMGGTIEVQTAPGVGTTFRLSFPVAQASTTVSDTPAPTRFRVLAVAEDVLTMQSITRGLRRDLDVEAAHDREAALAKLAEPTRFDAIVWQADLPGLGVVDLRRQLAARDPELAERVVALAARGEIASPPVITRPLDPAELRTLLGALLREGNE